jgi:hypothetical protein
MSVAQNIFVPVLICVAGLTFAAGRVVTKPGQPVIGQGPTAISEKGKLPDLSSPISVPDHVPDLASLPFVETYRIIKAARPERVTAYCNELEQLPRGPARDAALFAFFKTLIQANPALTKHLILQLKKDERWLPLQAIREAATPRGMETVAEVLLSFDRIDISGCSFDTLRDSLDDWGKTDPLALKQFLETHREQDVDRYFGTLVENWAAYDPEAARNWMTKEIEKRPFIPTRPTEDGGEEIFDSEWRSTVESMSAGWVRGFLAYDPEAATRYVVDHADNPAVDYALNWLPGDLFLVSPDQARDLIGRLPEVQQSKSLRSVADKADSRVRSDASDNSTSPRYVAEWLMKFPPQTYREGIGWVLRTWETADPQELFAWIVDLPGPGRDQIVQQFPTANSETTQEEFDTLMQVPDPALRTQLLEHLAREATSTQTKLRRVLERSQLPAEDKARLISLIPKAEYETTTVDDETE